MEDNNVEKKPSTSAKQPITSRLKDFFIEIRSEFRKVVWPSRHTLKKQTITVIITSLVLGGIVFVYDTVFLFLLRLFVTTFTK